MPLLLYTTPMSTNNTYTFKISYAIAASTIDGPIWRDMHCGFGMVENDT